MEKISPSKSNVRVVRCPRCTRLLPEPTHVPLYTCGGCGTLLQAKHYVKRVHVGDKEDDSPSANSISCPQHYQEQNEGIDQTLSRNLKTEQLSVASSSEKEFSSHQVSGQPQSSYSSELAGFNLKDTSNPVGQDEIAVEDQFEAAESSRESASSSSEPILAENNCYLGDKVEEGEDPRNSELSLSISDNREMYAHNDFTTPPTEFSSPKKEQLQSENTVKDLTVKDKSSASPDEYENSRVPASSSSNNLTNTRLLYSADVCGANVEEPIESLNTVKSPECAYDGSKINQGEDYKSESDDARGVSTSIVQRTPPMLNVIEMPRIRMRTMTDDHFLSRSEESSYLYESSGSSSLVDDEFYNRQIRLQPYMVANPCYESSGEVYPHTRYLRHPYNIDSPQVFDDQRFFLRRKLQPARHVRPMLGAAPYVSCYQCLELLELPLDFLVFKTRIRNRVKCSSCSSTLEFTVLFKDGCRLQLVPCTAKSMASLGETELR